MSMQMWRKRKEKGGRWGGEGRRGRKTEISQSGKQSKLWTRGGWRCVREISSRVKWFGYDIDPWTQLLTFWPLWIFAWLGTSRHPQEVWAPLEAFGAAGSGWRADGDRRLGRKACKLSSFEFSRGFWVHDAVGFATTQTEDGAPSNCRSVRNDLSTVLYRVGPLGGGEKPHSNKAPQQWQQKKVRWVVLTSTWTQHPSFKWQRRFPQDRPDRPSWLL